MSSHEPHAAICPKCGEPWSEHDYYQNDTYCPHGDSAASVVESNHGRVKCVNDHVVKTAQINGRGPAFFPEECPKCGGLIVWRATFNG